jgi:hypothetical protein
VKCINVPGNVFNGGYCSYKIYHRAPLIISSALTNFTDAESALKSRYCLFCSRTFLCFLNSQVSFRFSKILPLFIALSQLIRVQIIIYYSSQIHFNIILPNCSYSLGFWDKIYLYINQRWLVIICNFKGFWDLGDNIITVIMVVC